MKIFTRFAACMVLASLAPPGVASAATRDEVAIRAVIETFRTAIIAMDKAALARLPASEGITFMSALDEATLAQVRKRRPAAKRLNPGSYGDFVTEITSSKDRQEETFSNIAIQSDGTIADVYFDYDFRENGVVTNSGHESWGLIHADDGWKISSIVYSISLPDAPAPAVSSVPSAASWRDAIRAFAQTNFRQPAWGFSHAQRDYRLAVQLAAADHVKLDDDVLYAAAYLHDMAAFAPWDKDGVDHADRAASLIEPILTNAGFPTAKIEAVKSAIRTHMFVRQPAGLEALYLHDADALDWLGAIGVARITALVDPAGGQPDGVGAIKRIQANLAAVPARVLSPAGRALLPGRMAETEAYLRQLRAETNDLTEL